jgi:hypothetical protein
MKIKFCNDNNANIHSKDEDIFDLEKDLGLKPEEWREMSESDRLEMVKEWALEKFEYWYEELS